MTFLNLASGSEEAYLEASRGRILAPSDQPYRMHKPTSGRGRTVRDPIHNDVPLGPVQAAIIDTPVFQRLRYIKQNGLLHFVFPGAVHTRFSHSIGTMCVAGGVFSNLFPSYRPARPADVQDPAVRYLGQVFETAALVHDIGHIAFSHSIEHIDLPSGGFLRSLQDYAREWDGSGELAQWLSRRAETGELDLTSRPSHEDIGLLLIGMVFAKFDRVSDVCRSELHVEPSTFADDVRALIHPKLRSSEHFRDCASQVSQRVPGIDAVAERDRPEHLKSALSSLISGTVDVDRMDYLVRDSHSTGTVYGNFDRSVIVHALQLCVGESGDPTLYVGIHKRAVQAVDDFLWSRYQLFSQVLNHKTNVILNALLAEALPEAVDSSSVPIGQPRSWEEFLEFTDDFVMSRVISASLRDQGRSRRMYHKALVARELPLYLGRIDITGCSPEAEQEKLAAEQERLRKEVSAARLDAQSLRTWNSESALIKGSGLPFVIDREKLSGDIRVLPPADSEAYQLRGWTAQGKLPTTVRHAHFFVDRTQV